jgi:uncharacterized membrane protein (UPF0136 family)
MATVSAKQKTAAVLAGLYGIVSLTGGIIGYVKADSIPSLAAGGGCGVLLILCAVAAFYKPLWALLAAAVISIALLGRFLPAVLRHLNDSESAITWVPVVMSIGGLLVLFSAAFAIVKPSGGG